MQARGPVIADVAAERAAECRLGGKDDAAGELRFERMKERLDVRVVARTAHARALEEAEARHVGTEGFPHVLRAAIAVKDDAGRRARPRRAGEHGTGDSGRAAPREGLREHAARVVVHHDGEIAPALHHAEVSEIANPHLVGARDGRGPEPVGVVCVTAGEPRFGAVALHGLRAEPARAHEPRDAADCRSAAGAR